MPPSSEPASPAAPANGRRPRLAAGSGLAHGWPAACALTVVAAAWFGSALPAHAAGWWRPGLAAQRFDLQLTAPFDLARPVDVLALDPFGTAPERLKQLRGKGVATVCHLAAGLWENWRPDAPSFPQAALGRSPTGWQGQRWLDLRQPALRPILEKRLDLCRERGFAGALLAGLDAHAHGSGFDLKPADQLAFNRWLAEAAHARGLGVGIVGDLAQTAELAPAYDFLVAEGCTAGGDGCPAGVRPFLAAGKPVYLVTYTNNRHRMDTGCALAAELGAPLIFKTAYPNGKLHRRCG